jgi:hypothetical protein
VRKFRLKQITYLDGFAAGAFWTTLVFLIVFMILDFPISEPAWIGMLGSFIVALFTIGAAFFALKGNRLQIMQTNDIEDERGRNSLVAAKAVLPAILSEISTVASNNLRLRFQAAHTSSGFGLSPATVFQPLPENIIPGLKECIEHADEVSQDRLANILRYFQVLQARRHFADICLIPTQTTALTPDTHNAISDAIGWATVYALVSEAFPFARGALSPIPSALNPDRVRGAFLSAGIMLDNYPNLQTILEDRIAANRLERSWIDPL